MNKKLAALYVLFLVLLYSPLRSFGENTASEEIKIYSFAENLFFGSDYYRAITEYKRLLFYFPNSRFSPEAKFQIAKSYQLGDKFIIAKDLFDALSKEYIGKEIEQISIFESAECLYKMGDYEIALNFYKRFLDDPKMERLKDYSLYRKGFSEFHLRDVKTAQASFKAIPKTSYIFDVSSEMIQKTDEFENLNRKNPFLSGILSALVPGTGQFYNGRVKDGIIAIITNGLFAWGTYEAFNRKFYSIGIIASVFSFGWYAGNIYGAVNGAYRYNLDKENKFFESLIPRYEPISPSRGFISR